MPLDPLSTLQSWEFNTPPQNVGVNGLGPDGGTRIFNPRTPTVFPEFLTGGAIAGNNAWFGLGDRSRMNFNIPNIVDDEIVKFIQVQVTVNDRAQMPSIIGIEAEDPSGPVMFTPPSVMQVHPPTDIFGEGFDDTTFDFYVFQWLFTPNPDTERFSLRVPDGTGIFQVVVDTISVPEPSAIILLITGVLVVLGLVRLGGPAPRMPSPGAIGSRPGTPCS